MSKEIGFRLKLDTQEGGGEGGFWFWRRDGDLYLYLSSIYIQSLLGGVARQRDLGVWH